MTSAPPPTCPVCATPSPRRIVHGSPGPDLFDDPDISLGGCMVAEQPPEWRCRNPSCVHEFGRAVL